MVEPKMDAMVSSPRWEHLVHPVGISTHFIWMLHSVWGGLNLKFMEQRPGRINIPWTWQRVLFSAFVFTVGHCSMFEGGIHKTMRWSQIWQNYPLPRPSKDSALLFNALSNSTWKSEVIKTALKSTEIKVKEQKLERGRRLLDPISFRTISGRGPSERPLVVRST